MEGDELLLAELGADALGDEADLRRTDRVQALEQDDEDEQDDRQTAINNGSMTGMPPSG